jgi:hypothetical protein
MSPDPLTVRLLTTAVQLLMLAAVGGALHHVLLRGDSRRFWREAWEDLLGRSTASDHIDGPGRMRVRPARPTRFAHGRSRDGTGRPAPAGVTPRERSRNDVTPPRRVARGCHPPLQ